MKMTEQEAIDVLLQNVPKCCKMVDGRYQGGFDNWDCDMGQAIKVAVLALQDVRNYRKIGTVEECQEAREKQIPKRPIVGIDKYGNEYTVCRECQAIVEFEENRCDYCPDCGQAIQWD